MKLVHPDAILAQVHQYVSSVLKVIIPITRAAYPAVVNAWIVSRKQVVRVVLQDITNLTSSTNACLVLVIAHIVQIP